MFRFRLQRVLDLRAKKEKQVAGDLAAARTAEEEKREACERLEAAHQDGVQRVARSQGAQATVGQLQNLRLVVDRMHERIVQAQREQHAAEEHVRQRMEEFTEAFRERRVIEQLRERDLAAWQAEEVSADRQAMDDIALSRFVRAEPLVAENTEEKE